MSTLILALAVAATLGVVATRIATGATKRLEHEPRPNTRDDPRCLEVERKLDDARRAMVARGTPLLLVNRKAWERVTVGNVIFLRGNK